MNCHSLPFYVGHLAVFLMFNFTSSLRFLRIFDGRDLWPCGQPVPLIPRGSVPEQMEQEGHEEQADPGSRKKKQLLKLRWW